MVVYINFTSCRQVGKPHVRFAKIWEARGGFPLHTKWQSTTGGTELGRGRGTADQREPIALLPHTHTSQVELFRNTQFQLANGTREAARTRTISLFSPPTGQLQWLRQRRRPSPPPQPSATCPCLLRSCCCPPHMTRAVMLLLNGFSPSFDGNTTKFPQPTQPTIPGNPSRYWATSDPANETEATRGAP